MGDEKNNKTQEVSLNSFVSILKLNLSWATHVAFFSHSTTHTHHITKTQKINFAQI